MVRVDGKVEFAKYRDKHGISLMKHGGGSMIVWGQIGLGDMA